MHVIIYRVAYIGFAFFTPGVLLLSISLLFVSIMKHVISQVSINKLEMVDSRERIIY